MTVLPTLALLASVSRAGRAEEQVPLYVPPGWAGRAGVHSKLTTTAIATGRPMSPLFCYHWPPQPSLTALL